MMKQVILLIVFGVAFSVSGNAQLIKFIKSYGNSGYDYGRDIKEDIDSGFVVTGSSSSFADNEGDAYLLKVDSMGYFMWSYNYGGQEADWGESLVITSDSTYAIGGYSNSFGGGDFDFYLIRAGADGTPLWQRTYGGTDWDRAHGLVQLPDDGFVLVGETYSFGNGEQNGYIVRTDAAGDTIWTKVIYGPGNDFLNSVALDGDSLVIVGGSDSYGSGMLDGLIIKMHIDGTIATQKYVGEAYDDYFNAVDVVGSYYAMGGVRSYVYTTDKNDFWFYKTQNDLVEVYDTTYSNATPENDGINDVTLNPFNQDMYYVGYTASYGYLLDGLPDIFLGKMSSTPIFVTSKNYGEKGNDIGQALDFCKDYGVVFVCDSKYFATGGNNIIIVKLNYLWTYPGQVVNLEWDNITNGIEDDVIDDSENQSMLYPNPFQNEIQFRQEIVNGEINVYSIDGQLIYGDKIEGSTVDLSFLAPGAYIIKINSEGSIISRRMIKH